LAATDPAVDPDTELLRLGMRLFDVGGAERPPFVERVRTGSAMERAGLQADDLILSVNGVMVSSVTDVREQVRLQNDGPFEIVVKRGARIEVLSLALESEA
jgi:S1-C subfamily serine protease